MKYELIPNSCRTCLRKCKRLRSLYKPLEEGDEIPYEMLKQITGISIDELKSTDGYELPKHICKDCILSLSLAYEFRTKALRTHMRIEALLDQRNLLPNDEVENAEYLEEEFDTLSPLGDEEPLSPGYPNASINCCNSSESDINMITKLENNQTLLSELDSSGKRSESMQSVDAPKKIRRENKQHISTLICEKQTSQLEDKCNINNGYICDICGNIYSKRFRLMEHRRGHDEELRYACELCDKKFNLREKLRKHMYAHKDKKPYKCSFCSRTFYFESLKRSHEEVHQGIKPHICDICNRAFAYSQALKNHKLIHTKIKLFHCEYCNKDFRLQHHLKQHQETKLHQNAVKSVKDNY